MRRPRLGFLLLGSVSVGLATWLSLGSLAVGRDGARVGALPSPIVSVLVAALALAAGLAARRHAARLLPLAIVALLALPWLPLPVPPAFLAWSGPMVWWVWILAAVAVLAGFRIWRPRGLGRLLRNPRRAPLAAFGLALVLFGAGFLASRTTLIGDEPHYLVIVQSLLKDHNLAIDNNHEAGDYRAFFPGELNPDFLQRGLDGRIYSSHAPGLPALVAPAFALGGYRAVVLFLIAVSALGTVLVWRATFLLTADAAAAWFAWAVLASSVPFFFHSFAVFPEAPCATVVALCAVVLLGDERERAPGGVAGAAADDAGAAATAIPPWRWLLVGAALALLPWLHSRYAALSGALGVIFALRLAGRRRWRALAWFAMAPLVGAAAWFGYFHAIYGVFDPSVATGGHGPFSTRNLPVSLPALLFDQGFGLLPQAPVYAAGLLGLASLFAWRTRLAAEFVLIAAAYLAAVSLFVMWWAGWSPPARFLVPVLPLLAIGAGHWWAGKRTALERAMATLGLACGAMVTTTLATVERGALVFAPREGTAGWLTWLSPLVDLPRGFPSFLRDSPSLAWLGVLAWLASLALGSFVLRGLARSGPVAPARRTRAAPRRARLRRTVGDRPALP